MGGQCSCNASMCFHGQHHGRRFLTKEEKIKQLETYADELKKEIAAVNERITELKS
jgi:iron uptake system EfeUOB component EfeO/EfeM